MRPTALLALAVALASSSPAAAQLAIAIEANPGVALPGEQLEVRVTVTNQSAFPVSSINLNLTVPNGLDPFPITVVSPTSGGCHQLGQLALCESGETLIKFLGTIQAGQSNTVSLTPIVAAGAIGPIVFGASVFFAPSGTASASAAVSVDAARTLDLSLHELRDPVAAGSELAYTLHFGNTSTTVAAPAALLTLPVPAGTSFVSASDGGALNAGSVEWPLGTLAPGESGTRSVTLATDPGLVHGTQLLASAELSDTSPQLASARALTEIDALEALDVALRVGPDPAEAGEQLEIQITVTNRSAADLAQVLVLLRWPQQIDAVFVDLGNPSPTGSASCVQIVDDDFCTAGEFTQWSLPIIEPGGSRTFTYAADLAATTDGSVVDFVVTAWAEGSNPTPPGGERAEAGAAVAVQAAHALALALHEATDPVPAGGDLVYTLSYGNRSATDAAPGARLSLPLPAGTTFVSASGGGALNAGSVEWLVGTIEPGASGSRSVTLATDAGLADHVLLQADAALSDASLPAQRARARAVTEIDAVAPLVAIAIGPDPAAVGEQLEIEITVSNPSASPTPSLSLRLRWPQQIDPLKAAQGTPSVSSCPQFVPNADCIPGEISGWALGTLNAGQSVTVSYSADLATTPDGSLVPFEVRSVDPALSGPLVVSGGSALGRAQRVDSARLLELGLAEAADPIAAGDPLVYTLHFANTSTGYTAPSARLELPLPEGTTFVSASDGGALNGDRVEWSLGALAPGAVGARSVTLATDAGLVRGTLLRAEAALSDASLPTPVHASGVTEIDGQEALETTAQYQPLTGQVDVTVANTDSVSHTGVTLTLRVPRHAQSFPLASATPAATGCNQIANTGVCDAGEFLLWNLGTLSASQSVSVTVPSLLFTVPPGKSSEIFELNAIALGSGTDDRSAAKVVPEPGAVGSLCAGLGLLAALARRRGTRTHQRR